MLCFSGFRRQAEQSQCRLWISTVCPAGNSSKNRDGLIFWRWYGKSVQCRQRIPGCMTAHGENGSRSSAAGAYNETGLTLTRILSAPKTNVPLVLKTPGHASPFQESPFAISNRSLLPEQTYWLSRSP